MQRETNTVERASIGRPIAAIGIEVAAVAALASVAFLVELLVRWSLQ